MLLSSAFLPTEAEDSKESYQGIASQKVNIGSSGAPVDKPQAKQTPITHPLSLLSMFLLGLNDHYLKWNHPSYLTGKLSDFAGLVFFPLLLEYALRSRVLSVVVTGICFTLVKTTTVGNLCYNTFHAELYALLGLGRMVPLIADPADCLALLALYIPLKIIPPNGASDEYS